MNIVGNIVDVVQKRTFKVELQIKNSKIFKIKELGVEDPSLDYIMPGFVDAHIHIESSMVTPTYFANHVKRFGTLAVITDPHEISNVCGVEGFDYMYNQAKKSVIDIYFGVPSCVPATSFETSGAVFDEKTIDEIFQKYDTVALSEMMNFPGVVNQLPDVMKKIEVAKKYKKRIDGHAPALRNNDLQKYINAGITTDHESFSLEEAREKIQKGMKIQIREGSAARNYTALSKLIEEHPNQVMFCTDDAHPDTLKLGHIDRIVKMAANDNHNIFNIIKAASVNAINHYNLQIGFLQCGHSADFIVVNNLKSFKIKQSWLRGEIIYSADNLKSELNNSYEINHFKVNKINLKHLLISDKGTSVRVIQAIDGELITKKRTAKLPVLNGNLQPDLENDILKMVVVNRYKKEIDVKIGFVNGFGIKKGAFASSVAHDSHNIICVGTNDDDMLKAINNVIKHKGGISFNNKCDTIIIPLPVGGLMANESVENMAIQYAKIDAKVKQAGCIFQAPFMTLAFMSLLVIPSLKLGDRGLFDVNKFDFISLYVTS